MAVDPVSDSRRPLDGTRVVSVAEQYPGPYAAMLLADLGADVVIVERPNGGDPARVFRSFHAAIARGKRSLALDLKDSRARAAFMSLVRQSDVVLEGYRPGTATRLGIDYEALASVNPRIVYVSISGYGQDGPERDRTGHDVNYQAVAGMLAATGLSEAARVKGGGTAAPEVAFGDLVAGLFAVQAALLGLFRREQAGQGSYTDVSMVDCLVSLLTAHISPSLNSSGPGGVPYEPGYGVFATADRRLVSLGIAHEDHFWRAFCDTAGLAEDREMTSAQRFAAHERLSRVITDVMRGRTLQEWSDRFAKADVPFAEVLELGEVADHPQVRARDIVQPIVGPRGATEHHIRQPLKIDDQCLGPSVTAPTVGEHTVEVLVAAGVSRAEVDRLLESGAVAQA